MAIATRSYVSRLKARQANALEGTCLVSEMLTEREFRESLGVIETKDCVEQNLNYGMNYLWKVQAILLADWEKEALCNLKDVIGQEKFPVMGLEIW